MATARFSFSIDACFATDPLNTLLGFDRAARGAFVTINFICWGAGFGAFTGSTATARAINLALAQKQGPIVPLIALRDRSRETRLAKPC